MINSIAVKGKQPWGGQGHILEKDSTPEEWIQKAGLDYTIKDSPLEYYSILDDGLAKIQKYIAKRVLYRSDTGLFISVMSLEYKFKNLQPKDILEFYNGLAKTIGTSLEAAGTLNCGKKIWAVARVGEGLPIRTSEETLYPYLLFATSYDGSLATTIKCITRLITCNNMFSVSVHADTPTIKINHKSEIDNERLKAAVHKLLKNFIDIQNKVKEFSKEVVTEEEAILFLIKISQYITKRKNVDICLSRIYTRLKQLLEERPIGFSPSDPVTKWMLLNIITQWVDHERGRTNSTRLDSAWFGEGDKIKTEAFTILSNMVAE